MKSLTKSLISCLPLVCCALVVPAVLAEPPVPVVSRGLPGNWSATLQSGIAQGMQLSLGGLYNKGPAQQNRLTINGVGVLRSRDVLQFYGWNTTDLRNHSTDADVGVRYRAPVARVGRGVLTAGSGLEYWYFPSVLGGQRDWTLDSYLSWSAGEKIPITFSGNGKTLLRSRLPHGTMGIFQAQHVQKIAKVRSAGLSLQHGPVYIYNWNLYGRPGHRAFRYSAALQLNGKRWGLEGAFRPQAGLQPRIPDNRFWSVSVIRKLW